MMYYRPRNSHSTAIAKSEECLSMDGHQNIDNGHVRCGVNDDNNPPTTMRTIDLTVDLDDSSDEEFDACKGDSKVGPPQVVLDKAVSCKVETMGLHGSNNQQVGTRNSTERGLITNAAVVGEATSADAAPHKVQNTGADDKYAEVDTENLQQLEVETKEKYKTLENSNSTKDAGSVDLPPVSIQQRQKHRKKTIRVLQKIRKSVPFLKQLEFVDRMIYTGKYQIGWKEFAVDVGEAYGLGSKISSDENNTDRVQVFHLQKLHDIFKKYDALRTTLFEVCIDAYCKAAGAVPDEVRRRINQAILFTAMDDNSVNDKDENDECKSVDGKAGYADNNNEEQKNANKKGLSLWIKKFDKLMRYKREHGDFNVPSQFKVAGGIMVNPIYSWVRAQRANYKAGQRITSEQINMLEEAGFEWDPPKRKMGRQNRDNNETIPRTENPEKKQPSADEKWEIKFRDLRRFKEEFGDWDAPRGALPIPLQSWICMQRHEYVLFMEGKSSAMTKERISLLEGVGFVWQSKQRKKYSREDEAWDESFRELRVYIKQYNDMNVTFSENPSLFQWIKCQREQRTLKDKGKRSLMNDQRLDLLNNISFRWEQEHLPGTNEDEQQMKIRSSPSKMPVSQVKKFNDEPILKRLEELKRYKKNHGDLYVKSTNEHKSLYNWVTSIRVEYRNKVEENSTKLTDAQIKILDDVGFQWQGTRRGKRNDQSISDPTATKGPDKRKVCALDNDSEGNFISQHVAKYFDHADGNRVLYLGVVTKCNVQIGRRIYTIRYTDDSTEEVEEKEIAAMLKLYSQSGRRNKRSRRAFGEAVPDQSSVTSVSALRAKFTETPSVATACNVGTQANQADLCDNEVLALRRDVRKLRKENKRYDDRIQNVSSELREVRSVLYGVQAQLGVLMEYINTRSSATQTQEPNLDIASSF